MQYDLYMQSYIDFKPKKCKLFCTTDNKNVEN